MPSRTLGMDIIGYDPGDPNSVKEWDEVSKGLFDKVKAAFDEKGIPMPTLVIDTSKEPITYAIKTTDENGNIIHSQP